MKKLYLMRNPELFQGEKHLKKDTTYFEGWYFKNSNQTTGISFIPGINISKEEKNAFIQVITHNESYFIKYCLEDFEFSHDPFFIKIKDNFFSKEKLHIDIQDDTKHLKISGDLKYTNGKNIKTNCFYPNIMGPFSYIPFMECNHAILAMENKIKGTLNLNNKKIKFNNGVGYIEKDWGTSFPKYYIWCQANNFEKTKASFMASIADIDFKAFHFKGLISVLKLGNKEYKFTTYNNSKVIKYDVDDKNLDITLKKGPLTLNIKSNYNIGHKLIAPVKGQMTKDVFESISEKLIITLKKKDDIIFSDTASNCGLEIVPE